VITLEELNALPAREFVAALGPVFEHSPWVPERVAGFRPYQSGIALHEAMCGAVMQADESLQLALIRAHPELAGRAAIRGDLTSASISEQKGAGLSACTPLEFERLQSLNAAYRGRFDFPFVLAVKGHTPESVIAALQRRVAHGKDEERSIALQEICRIARFRLADLVDEPIGGAIIAMAEDLARFSETPDGLTCSYLTPTHIATAARIRDFMLAAGLTVHGDAVGNVVGVLPGDGGTGRHLLTGSHYDTVINAGKYDGRLGILLPIAVAGAMRRAGLHLPYALEIIAFAEEEGVRFKSTFLGSRAVAGQFEPDVLESVDAQGISLGAAIAAAGHDAAAIDAIARDPALLLGFVEVHIEQGPVLLDAGMPLGVVTSIAGSIRRLLTVQGLSGHAGTVPMALRHDAAAAAAEIVLAVERRCAGEPGLVGTVGKLEVPGGAVNVIPGRCELSIDIRSGRDAVRDAAVADIDAEIERIAQRRGVGIERRTVLEAASVPCAVDLQDAWSASIERVTGEPAPRLPSGAGHDAMMMASVTDIGMLFVRCGNGGISHNPAETLSADDAAVAARVFQDFLQHFKVPA
jgi:beta-ureidopropionase / N-carbamoyl-L-amino-acid hydrolase